jgi:hypothetical protein
MSLRFVKKYHNVLVLSFFFKVCQSVNHRTIQINQPTRWKFSQVYYLTFMYSSTCFRRLPTHHQEHTTAVVASGFYRWSVVVAVLLFVVGPAGPDHNQKSFLHQTLQDFACITWQKSAFSVLSIAGCGGVAVSPVFSGSQNTCIVNSCSSYSFSFLT